MSLRVLGVDGCRKGWAGAVWDGVTVSGAFSATLADLVRGVLAAGPLDVVGVDTPIGLADSGARDADRLVQRELGRRSSSIFVTPARPALAEADRARASELNVALGGPGITVQAWSLRPKILEVDDYARIATASPRLIEVHPELSFATLGGRPLPDSKRTWAGASERRRLLRQAGLDIDLADLGDRGRMADSDDVVDAAVAAWSAMRVAQGRARCLPEPPQRFGDGLDAAIWA